jgi:hypothetical protein
MVMLRMSSAARLCGLCGLLLGLSLGACSEEPAEMDNGLGGAGAGSAAGAGAGTAGAGAGGTGAGGAAGASTNGGASGGSASGSAGSGAAGSAEPDDQGAAGSAGAAGAAGDGPEAGAGGDAGAGGTEERPRPPCTTKPSQVAILGDSYINWVSHTFPQDMADAAGETWRMYAIGGWAMGSGGIGLIPTQVDTAIMEDPDIKAIVMTGGGNDILVPDAMWMGGADCRQRADSPTLKVCQDIVQTALDAAEGLMQKGADAGVKDVIYFFYPHVPEGTLIGGAHPNELLDYALPKTKQLCDDTEAMTQGRMRCHFIDTIPLFEGHPEYFAPTDIHENSMGSKVIADAIWARMQEECIAQDESSGCCEP